LSPRWKGKGKGRGKGKGKWKGKEPREASFEPEPEAFIPEASTSTHADLPAPIPHEVHLETIDITNDNVEVGSMIAPVQSKACPAFPSPQPQVIYANVIYAKAPPVFPPSPPGMMPIMQDIQSRPAFNCLICLQECTLNVSFLPCAHGPFHQQCLNTYLSTRRVCPICRWRVANIDFNQVINEIGNEQVQAKAASLPMIGNSSSAGQAIGPATMPSTGPHAFVPADEVLDVPPQVAASGEATSSDGVAPSIEAETLLADSVPAEIGMGTSTSSSAGVGMPASSSHEVGSASASTATTITTRPVEEGTVMRRVTGKRSPESKGDDSM
jgi:hypothetical protein